MCDHVNLRSRTFALCDIPKEELFTRMALVFFQPELNGMQVDVYGDKGG